MDVAGLKRELKAWENDFRAKNSGRNPSKQDIQNDKAIAAKYKLYAAQKSGKSSSSRPTASSSSSTSFSTSAASAPPVTPSKKKPTASAAGKTTTTNVNAGAFSPAKRGTTYLPPMSPEKLRQVVASHSPQRSSASSPRSRSIVASPNKERNPFSRGFAPAAASGSSIFARPSAAGANDKKRPSSSAAAFAGDEDGDEDAPMGQLDPLESAAAAADNDDEDEVLGPSPVKKQPKRDGMLLDLFEPSSTLDSALASRNQPAPKRPKLFDASYDPPPPSSASFGRARSGSTPAANEDKARSSGTTNNGSGAAAGGIKSFFKPSSAEQSSSFAFVEEDEPLPTTGNGGGKPANTLKRAPSIAELTGTAKPKKQRVSRAGAAARGRVAKGRAAAERRLAELEGDDDDEGERAETRTETDQHGRLVLLVDQGPGKEPRRVVVRHKGEHLSDEERGRRDAEEEEGSDADDELGDVPPPTTDGLFYRHRHSVASPARAQQDEQQPELPTELVSVLSLDNSPLKRQHAKMHSALRHRADDVLGEPSALRRKGQGVKGLEDLPASSDDEHERRGEGDEELDDDWESENEGWKDLGDGLMDDW